MVESCARAHCVRSKQTQSVIIFMEIQVSENFRARLPGIFFFNVLSSALFAFLASKRIKMRILFCSAR